MSVVVDVGIEAFARVVFGVAKGCTHFISAAACPDFAGVNRMHRLDVLAVLGGWRDASSPRSIFSPRSAGSDPAWWYPEWVRHSGVPNAAVILPFQIIWPSFIRLVGPYLPQYFM
jgi:hypothetical protein